MSDNLSNLGITTFDVGKHIALVQNIRESEVDSYFNAFKRIATSLGVTITMQISRQSARGILYLVFRRLS